MGPSAAHPLDPLSAEEITAAAEACKEYAAAIDAGQRLRFMAVSLQEPSKADLLAFDAGTGPLPERQAFCMLHAPPTTGTIEAVVTLPGAKVASWKRLPKVHGLATPDDCLEAEAIGRADPEVVRLLAERYAATDLSLVQFDPWSVHDVPPALRGRRLIQLFTYLKSSENDNAYAHPTDLVPIVDLNEGKVVHIEMYDEAPPIPRPDSNYHASLFPGPWRSDIKPLDVVQPEGPSFKVDGNLISWQKWSLRVGFNFREGLVLHTVGYEDGGRVRPVLHRASLVEMAVPYGDPRSPYTRKCAFDVSDYGLGYCANSLSLGCDCLGHIKYLDAVLVDAAGRPKALPHAVCIHEEDAGLLWKHVEYRNRHSESRRSRRLVLSFIATVVNYEYCFYWYLYQDGTIGYEIKLTGELSTNLLSPGEGPRPGHGTLVAPGVNAQHHQHMFCARLDFAVDDARGGKDLVVSEVDAVAMPLGPDNPTGMGFTALETDLTSVAQAQRDCNAATGRVWKVKNPSVLNPMSGGPVAYKLMPLPSPLLMSAPGSAVARRAVFAAHNLWVTPFAEAQRFPAGDYVYSMDECTGLSKYAAEDVPLSGSDPVVWYSFGVTHIVRVEDFPVMPCEVTGFMLKPFGFFSGNPGLDIPPGKNAASKEYSNGVCCGANDASGANGVH